MSAKGPCRGRFGDEDRLLDGLPPADAGPDRNIEKDPLIPEILVIAAAAKRNVSLFTSFDLDLRYEGGYYGGDGPVVNIKLTRNDEQEAERTHYERLIPAELAEELTETWHAEERERSAEKARQEQEAKRRRLEERARAELVERERKEAEKRKREAED